MSGDEKSATRRRAWRPGAWLLAAAALLGGPPAGAASISIGGDLGYSATRSVAGRDPLADASGSDEAWSLSLRAVIESVIWQPWFGRFNAGVAWTGFQARSGDASEQQSVTGNVGISLLPATRFPFSLDATRNDSRVSGSSFVGASQQSESLAVRQGYRSWDGRLSHNLAYSTRDSFKDDALEQEFESANWTTSWGERGYSLGLTADGTDLRSRVDGSRVTSARARLSYSLMPRDNLGLQAGVGRFETRENTLVNPDLRTQTDDADALVSWSIPGKKISLFGSVRLAQAQSLRAGVLAGDSDSAVASVGMSQALSDAWQLSGSASFQEFSSTFAATTTSSTQFLSLGYNPSSLVLGPFRYLFGFSQSLDAQQASTADSTASYGVNASQSLGWDHPTESYGTFGFSVSQGAGVANLGDKVRDVTRIVNHGLAVSWLPAQNELVSGVTLSVDESRTEQADREEVFRRAAVLVSGGYNVGRHQTLSGSVSVEYTASESTDGSGIETRNSTTQAYGSLAYAHNMLWGVRNLVLTSSLTLRNAALVVPVASDDEPEDTRWTNRLSYSIGRTTVSADGNFVETDAGASWFFAFRLQRSFGS